MNSAETLISEEKMSTLEFQEEHLKLDIAPITVEVTLSMYICIHLDTRQQAEKIFYS